MLFTSGVMPSVYYLSLFLVDCLAFGVSAIASFILLFSIPINFIRASNPLPLILVVLFFGPVTVLLSYILSFAFKSSKSVGPVLGVTVSLVVFVPYFIVDFALKNNVPAVFDFVIGFIIPTFGAYRALVDYALGPINGAPYTLVDTFNINRRVFPMILIFIAQILLYTFLIAVLHHRKATGKRFLVALSEVVSQIRSRKTPSTHHESSAIHPEDLPSTAIVVPAGSAAGAARVTDAEVLRETTKLMSPDFAGTLEDSEYIMAARGINKSFKISGDRTLNVLNNLVMGVKKNECFGFLGPNGAGKTTAINILTGNDFANSGEAFIGGYSVCPHFDPSARRMIGLCPQFNVLWDKLTPREHISAYGELRGIPSSELKAAVDQVISDMGLDDGQNQFTKTLSGGNKRKVSIAISMIGDPKLVFLDEPTTGVDISIRQKIWQGIEKLKERSSIILTSHSMEEVDALSDRIAILINGQLRCLGTSQRLKNVYGSGYKIAVKLSSSSRSQALVDWLPTQIQSIPGLPIQCTVSKMIGSSVEFSLSILSRPAEAGAGEKQSSANYVEDTCILLSTGFQILERSKAEYGIVDYSFSQATLGHVFVELAKEQLSASDLEGSKSSKGGWRPFGLFRSS
ncbi:P-loop containing nucleoside triphosphate hydrolase protein [Polychytrium aggregatum]|uniref:P-loop containing nucleoside triphosphate hydrolase protein n=1 Tax=Polychytrium aggregatum TaxID=110093 RepID=UPI0022FF01E7|nr:P-loop containing nucleoside triphosphate hydrolase protein [Polychytrium aggregatum]KAI9209272.1 P-loop containing nucleoside triphosphate hydrolase protein [Polychytrium aggregatum]